VSFIISRSSFTHFEDLASEIIYEIFEFLDAYDVYKSFSNLNTRFQNIRSTIPIKISISSVSKLTLQTYSSYYSNFIQPNKHRIQTLYLSDPFIIDFFSSPTSDISKCSQLQVLILDKIQSQSMEKFLIDLTFLPKLTSLCIYINNQSNRIIIYNLIFQLPVLKYCKMTFEENIQLEECPISDNKSNSIEHFVINGKCDLNVISSILSCVPQLRRLSINYLYAFYIKEGTAISSMILYNLKHINLTLDNLNFDQFEEFIGRHFRQLEILHITTKNIEEYLNANKWKQLISCYIPHLSIVTLSSFGTLLNQFNSPLWVEQKCSFSYQGIHKSCKTGQIFFSPQPYR